MRPSLAPLVLLLLTAPAARGGSTFFGFGAYQWPCPTTNVADDTTACIGPKDFEALGGRQFSYRFAVREDTVASEGWTRYRNAATNVRNKAGQPVAVLTPRAYTSMGAFTAQAVTQLTQVNHFQVHNEPNGMGGTMSGTDYARYWYCPAAQAVASHSRRSAITLITGGLATPSAATNTPKINDLQIWIRQFLAAYRTYCNGAPLQGFGLHPYHPTATGTAELIDAVRRVLDHDGFASLPIYVTEWGSPTRPGYTEVHQRTLLIDASRWMLWNSGMDRCNLGGTYWFGHNELSDAERRMPDGTLGYADHTLAMRYHNGDPKLAWWAFLDAEDSYWARYGTSGGTLGVNTGGCHRGPTINTDQDPIFTGGIGVVDDGRRKVVIRPGQTVRFAASFQNACAWDFQNDGSAEAWSCIVERRFPDPGKWVVKFTGSSGTSFFDVHVEAWPASGAVAIPTTSTNWVQPGSPVTLYPFNYNSSASYGINGAQIVDCAWDLGDKGAADFWGCDPKVATFSANTRVKLGVKTSDGRWFFSWLWVRMAGDYTSGSSDYAIP